VSLSLRNGKVKMNCFGRKSALSQLLPAVVMTKTRKLKRYGYI
jgi:hypothetical protein